MACYFNPNYRAMSALISLSSWRAGIRRSTKSKCCCHLLYALSFFIFSIAFLPHVLQAEGTPDIAPSTLDEVALYVGAGNTGGLGGDYGQFAWKDSPSRLHFNVNSLTEIVYLGFSRAYTSRKYTGLTDELIFRIVAPDGTPLTCFGNVGIDGATGSGWMSLAPASVNADSRALVEAGPAPIAGASGYTPFTFDPSACGLQTGDYYVEFYSTDPTYDPNTSNSGFYIPYFDITVADNSGAAPTAIDGRIWSYNWGLGIKNDGDEDDPFDRAFNGAFYVCAEEGYITKIDFNTGINTRAGVGDDDQRSGFRAGNFNVSFNTTGVGTSGDVQEDRMSVEDLNSPNPQLKVFLFEPDESICPEQEFGDFIPMSPLMSQCDPNTLCVNIAASKTGQFDVLIEPAGLGDGVYDGGAEVLLSAAVTEVELSPAPQDAAYPYEVCVPWDGKDGLGNDVGVTDVTILATFFQGVYHFPVYDAEYNDDGYIVETIRPALGIQPIFYDDSNITQSNGTGEPKVVLNGCAPPCHRWTGEWDGAVADAYGNFNTVNTWWFASSAIKDITSNVNLPEYDICAIAGDDIVCENEPADFISNIGGIAYQWSGPGGFSANTPNTGPINVAGTYSVSVTTSDGCLRICEKDLEVYETPSISADLQAGAGGATTITCNTPSLQLVGTITVSNPSEWNIAWTNDSGSLVGSTNTVSITSGGTYTYTVTNTTTGCSFSSTAITVAEDLTPPTVSIPSVDVLTCENDTEVLSANGSTDVISYSWSTSNGSFVSGQNTANPTIDAAGTYTVTVTAANGCTDTGAVTVSGDFSTPSAEAGSAGDITCSTTTITLNGSSSSAGVSYQWTTTSGAIISGGNTASPTVSQAGIYTLTVTGSNGCSSTDQVTVGEDVGVPTADAGGDASGNGGTLNCNITSITLDATASSGAVSYSWSTANGNIVSGGNTATPTINEGGTYLLTITASNGCTNSDSVTIDEDFTTPTANAGSNAVINCSNPTATLDASGSIGAVSYSWSTTNGNIVSGGNTATPVVDEAGVYDVVITAANGCQSNDNVTITADFAVPNVDAGTGGNITCSVTSITLSGSSSTAGVAYSWASTDGAILIGGDTASPTVGQAGTYTLTVTAANGCSASDQVTVGEDTGLPTANAGGDAGGNGGTLDCNQTSMTLDASGSVGAVSYSWSTTDGNIVSGGSSMNPIINGGGTYVLTITAANGCQANDSVTISEDFTPPVANAGDLSGDGIVLNCNAPTATLNAGDSSSGVSYSWTTATGNIVSGANTATPTVDAAGTYTLTVTAANGCTDTDAINVSEDFTPPNALIEGAASGAGGLVLDCNSTQITLNASGSTSAVSYSWTTPDGTIISGANSASPTINSAGTYHLTVTAANGCTDDASVTVTADFDEPDVDISVSGGSAAGIITCANTTVSLNGSSGGASAFLWTTTNGLIVSGANASTVTVGAAGTYTLSVTAANGCVGTSSITVIEDLSTPNASISASNQLDCNNNTATLSVGGGGTNYTWQYPNGQVLSESALTSVTVTDPGTYIVTVTGANGCSDADSILLEDVGGEPEAVVTPPPPISCDNITVTLDGSASENASTYSWSTADGSIASGGNTAFATIDAPGAYTLSITTIGGCTAEETVVVSLCNEISVGFDVDVEECIVNFDTNCPLPIVSWENEAGVTGVGNAYDAPNGTFGEVTFAVDYTEIFPNYTCGTNYYTMNYDCSGNDFAEGPCNPGYTVGEAACSEAGDASVPVTLSLDAIGIHNIFVNAQNTGLTVAPGATVNVPLPADGSMMYIIFLVDLASDCSSSALTTVINPECQPCEPLEDLCVDPGSTIEICPNFCTLGSVFSITGTDTTYPCNIDFSSGCVNYNPFPATPLGYVETVEITACNDAGICETVYVEVTIGCIDPPDAENDYETTDCGETLVINAMANDNGSDGMNICGFTTPANGAVLLSGNELVYTPNAGFTGSDSFTYTICDVLGNSSTATIQVVVLPLESMTYSLSDDIDATNGETITLNVLANDAIAGLEATICTHSQAENGTLTLIGNTFSYEPLPFYTGTVSFTYTVCPTDPCVAAALGGETLQATVTINVDSDCNTDINLPCVEPMDPITICPSFCVDGDITITDFYSSTSDCSLELQGDACIEYTALPAFSGTDIINIIGCNSAGDCATTVVTIQVSADCDGEPSAGPIANDDNVTTDQNTSVTLFPMSNDSHPDGASFSITSISDPANGILIANGDGSYTYTPNAGFVGTDQFTYQICDEDGNCDTATITITVNAADVCNDIQVLCAEPMSPTTFCPEFCDLTDPVTNIMDATTTYNCILEIVEPNCITYTPLPLFIGIDTIEVVGCTAAGICDTTWVIVDVDPNCGESEGGAGDAAGSEAGKFSNPDAQDDFQIHSIMPVPAIDRVQLQFTIPKGGATMKLRDMNGKMVHAEHFISNGQSTQRELNVSTLPAGIYLVELEVNDKKLYTRMVKQ